MKNNCPQQPEAGAFVSGELSPGEARAFMLHLDDCACCRAAVEDVRSLHAILSAVPAPEPSADLTARILAAVRADTIGQEMSIPSVRPGPRHWFWPGVAAAAALVLGMVSLAGLFPGDKTGMTARSGTGKDALSAISREKAMDWFVQSQEADGSWHATRWGGTPQFQVALTALPAMVMLQGEPSTPGRKEAARRATVWLMARQAANGIFGPEFQGTPYNHSMATCALLHGYLRDPSGDLKSTLDRALAVITNRQLRDGGWGYDRVHRSDHSITEWNLAALELAQSLGWPDLDTRVERARSWLAGHPREADIEPEDSPSKLLANAPGDATGPDIYAAYFRVMELQRGTTPEARARLADLRHRLLEHQITDGTQSGSWPPDDRWGRAGGRLYSTALATMALAGP